MRPVSVFTLAATLGSMALLAACAGGSPPQTSLVPGASSPAAVGLHSRERGASPLAVCTAERRRQAGMANGGSLEPTATLQAYLYVVDFCGPVIDVLHTGNYHEFGYFSSGLSGPIDAFVDSHGNLYVANSYTGPGFNGHGNVTEYAPSSWNAPSFTYSVNMVYPNTVTTDVRGNVYEGDITGIVNEYVQNRNVSIANCRPLNNGDATSVIGVAVDSHNDVFATVYDGDTHIFELVEYPGGLNNCNGPTVLPLPLNSMYGIAVDKNGNLLITYSSGVAVVAPPYTTVNAQIGTGFVGATNVRLNRANGLAFVTDTSSQTVTVVNYPSGTNVTVLGTAYGLSVPLAAVEQPNAVY